MVHIEQFVLPGPGVAHAETCSVSLRITCTVSFHALRWLVQQIGMVLGTELLQAAK